MYEVHPILEAADIPLLTEGPEWESFLDDVRQHGVRRPVTLCRDENDGNKLKLLDGRRRDKAADETGRQIYYDTFPDDYPDQDDDPLAFITSIENRRNSTISQRAMYAANVANAKIGRPGTENAPRGAIITQEDAAKSVGVSRRNVQRAAAVLDSGDKELINEVKDGKKTVTKAAREVKEKKQQAEPVEAVDEKGVPIPRKLLSVFDWRDTVNTLANQVHQVKREIAQLGDGELGAWLDGKPLSEKLRACAQEIRECMPYAVCPACRGKGCKACYQSGWMPRQPYDNPHLRGGYEPKPKQERPADPMFDVTLELFAASLIGKKLSARDGKRWGSVATDLKKRTNDPDEVRQRWAACEKKFDNPGPDALLKHWDSLKSKTKDNPYLK